MIIYLPLLLLVLSTAASAASKWTVMIYWAVDNDLYDFSIPYLAQFEKIPASPNLNLYLEYDYDDERPNARFINFSPLETIGERNSASPATLIDFVQSGIKRYPADRYLLIVASHGSNWSGLIEDRTSKSYMTLAGFKTVLQSLPRKLDLIVFDACRMSYLETLAAIGPEINLMVGSTFDVNGFNHETPLTELVTQDLSPVELGKAYVRVYPAFPGNAGATDTGASLLSGTDLLPLPELAKFFQKIANKTEAETNHFREMLHATGEDTDDWGYDLMQILSRAAELFPELLFEATMLQSKLKPLAQASSWTPETLPQSGIALTCAEDIKHYGRAILGRALPGWVNICKSWRSR